MLVGSLVDSYGFKPGGLIKRTIRVKHKSFCYHIVSYYHPHDIKAGIHKRPGHDPNLTGVVPREELGNELFQVAIRSLKDVMIDSSSSLPRGDPALCEQSHQLGANTDYTEMQIPSPCLPQQNLATTTYSLNDCPLLAVQARSGQFPFRHLQCDDARTGQCLMEGQNLVPSGHSQITSMVGRLPFGSSFELPNAFHTPNLLPAPSGGSVTGCVYSVIPYKTAYDTRLAAAAQYITLRHGKQESSLLKSESLGSHDMY